MQADAHTGRLITLIVFLTICAGACKSKKAPAETGFGELNIKFERLYIEACTQFNIGNYSTALTQFNKCADIRPDEASVYFQISKIKQKLKEDNDAFQNGSKANGMAPGNKFYAAHFATLLRNVGDYKKAIEVLEVAINANPKDENLYNSLDDILQIRNETDKRIALWQKYRQNVGFRTAIGLKLINLYKLKKDYTSAHAMYDELKRAAPNKAQFYIEDAKLYEEQKDAANANLNYEKAIESNPNNWEVNYALYQFYANKGDREKAENYLNFAFEKSAVAFDVKIPASQQLLKQVKADPSHCNFAMIASQGLIKNYTTDAKALFTAAELFAACGKYKEAQEYYSSASNLNPNLFDAWIGAMNAGIILKQYPATIETGQKAIEYFPNTALLFLIMAKAGNLGGNFEKAFEYSVMGENIAFDDDIKSGLYLQKGLSLYHLQKYTEALKVIESAIIINTGDPELYDVLGDIYYYLKDEEKAINSWKKAKDMGSRNSLIDKKIRERKVYE